jgi:hypothetical protein
MKYFRLFTYQEACWILQGLTFWKNDIGEQAKRILYWYKKHWIAKHDLKDLVRDLLGQAAEKGLLEDGGVLRIIIHEQIKDLALVAEKFSSVTSPEELLAWYMLVSKESGTDTENAIYRYFDLKEKHQEELNNWRECYPKPRKRRRKKYLGYWQKRKDIFEKRKALAEKNRRMKMENWLQEEEVAKVWAEERQELFARLGLKGADNAEYQD